MKAVALAVIAASCADPAGLPAVRFANAPPVTAVDDRRDVAIRPERSLPLNELDFYDRSFAGPILRAFALPTTRRARGVNAIDEVPDSTWFTNRIGIRDLTPDDIAAGPVSDEGPEPHKPWTVHSTKVGGTEPGLIVSDARGVKYLVSFDDPSRPEMETGAAVVTNRLLWAAGYNVPADQIVYVGPAELVLARDAMVKDHLGHALKPLDRAGLDRELAKAWHTPDGRIRVLASRWLDGEPLGGTPAEGVRAGDPNDRIPHQHRRDQRGQYPVLAWVDHVDLVQSNFLDMWIRDPRDPAHHYVLHYKVDFGKSLGTMGVTDRYVREGHASSFDWGDMATSALSFGLAPRPWGQHFAPDLPGVAPTFVAEGFDPGRWQPDLPYPPFQEADRFDMFWGAKLLARFTRDQIAAAVAEAQYSDPRAAAHLTDTLVARQRATVAYWFARVNPVDRFAIDGDALCFADLAIEAGLVAATGTIYELAAFESDGRLLGTIQAPARPGGAACARGLVVGGYTIVKLTTRRARFAGSTYVHLARSSAGELRVIGVWRI